MKTEVAVLAAVAALGGLALSAPPVRSAPADAVSAAFERGEKGGWGSKLGHTEKAIVQRRRKNKESRRQRRANKKRGK